MTTLRSVGGAVHIRIGSESLLVGKTYAGISELNSKGANFFTS